MSKTWRCTTNLLDIAGLMVIAMFFILDRGLKQAALAQGPDQALQLIGSWLSFKLTFNPYIAFSLPVSGYLLNALISLIVLSLFLRIIYLIINKKKAKTYIIPLTFLLFGAISNLLDRYLYDAVVDYLDLRYFTVFNIADIMISGSVIFILIKQLRNN